MCGLSHPRKVQEVRISVGYLIEAPLLGRLIAVLIGLQFQLLLSSNCISELLTEFYYEGTRRYRENSVLVGIAVGDIVGASVGIADGKFVGSPVGIPDGDDVGALVGIDVGDDVGSLVGTAVGGSVGALVGVSVGVLLGLPVGIADGGVVGALLGILVGNEMGTLVGIAVRDIVGACKSVAVRIGSLLGPSKGVPRDKLCPRSRLWAAAMKW